LHIERRSMVQKSDFDTKRKQTQNTIHIYLEGLDEQLLFLVLVRSIRSLGKANTNNTKVKREWEQRL